MHKSLIFANRIVGITSVSSAETMVFAKVIDTFPMGESNF